MLRGSKIGVRTRQCGRPCIARNSLLKLYSRKISIGLFGDIHFQEKGLDRIKRSGEWIINEFKKQQVQAIVCLGDILNTREIVNIEAQSAAFEFFHLLRRSFPDDIPIHVIMGNHDMNLRHSRKISSLDVLGLGGTFSTNFHLHREISHISLPGHHQALILPYHHDQDHINEYINNLLLNSEVPGKVPGVPSVPDSEVSKLLVFGHLAISGARQNNMSIYLGSLKPSIFSRFKRVFSGHFHSHHELKPNIVYVGSPLQFNFGDSGEDKGVVIYSTEEDSIQHIPNPFGNQFMKITEAEIASKRAEIPDKHVMVVFDKLVSPSYFQSVRNELLKCGALSVRKHSTMEQLVKTKHNQQTDNEREVKTIQQLIEEYVKIVFEKLNVLQKKSQSQKSFLSLLDSTEKIQKTVDVGKSIVDSVHTSTPVGNEGQTFTAEIQTLIMENFMSVQGKLEISFASLNDGIWIIDGSNGSGKSTIFEAIVWCQFGSYLRDGMTANDCINDKAKECRVWLEYENGFIIERTRKRGSPSSIQTYQRDPLTGHPTYISENEKGTTADSQKRINQILGIDCETFVKSVVMSQNTVNNFFSGNLQRRREIVEEMLGLGGLEGYVENARAARQEKEKLVDKYTEEIQRLCFDRDALIRATSEIERSIEMNMRELSEVEKMKNTEREIWMKGNLGSLMDEKDTLQQQKSKETSDIEYTKEYLLKDVQEVAQSLESSRNVIQQLYTLKESLIKALDIQDRKICSGCGRPIDNREQHELHTKQLFEEIKAINSIIPEQHLPAFSITDLQSALLYFNEAILKLKEHVERQESLLLGHKRNEFKISNLQMSMATLELRLSQNHNQILQVESNFANHIKEIETQLLKLQLEIQHKERNVAQNRQKMKEFCVRIEEIDQALQNERTQFELLKFWEISFDRKSKTTTGFSSFRSFLFEGAITELNLILQQYMEQLSLDYSRDLSATLDSELELVEHYGKKSGGERKRTDLAILFSLFEMVLDHSRYQPAFVLLDEVFDALDFSGRVAVQSVLSTISKRVKKVFVITHSDIALGASIAGTFSVKMSVNNEGEALGTEISINHV